MYRSRVELNNSAEFYPRDWLRREMLWASMMAPYSEQINTWLNGTALHQHQGNVSRKDLYAKHKDDPNMLSPSFFNQGKNIAGLLSSSALFKAMVVGGQEGSSVNLLKIQAKTLDKQFSRIDQGIIPPKKSEKEVYETCEDVIYDVYSHPDKFGNKQKLLRAGNLMADLALAELSDWLEVSRQDESQSLPLLMIDNGGKARSTGPRVAMLKPLFEKVVNSEDFLAI